MKIKGFKMKKLKLALSVLSMCIVSSPVMAAPKQKVSGVYFGGSAGFSKIVLKDSYGAKHSNESGSSFQLLGGYQFNRIIGIEVDYLNYGENEKFGGTNVMLEPVSLAAQANIGYTFNSGFRPFALVGVSSVSLNQESDIYKEDTYVGGRIGAGVEYAPAIIGGWAIRLAYSVDYVKANTVGNVEHKHYLTNMSLGLNYKF